MLIIGIDPGTATCGYGVIRMEGSRLIPLEYGVFSTPSTMQMHLRLRKIYRELHAVISKYPPDCIAVEKLFFNKNVTTGITVAQARGIILLAAAECDLPVVEFTPLEVKQAVVGYGKAEKKQVQFMVQKLLGLTTMPKPDDAADALAISICALHESGSLQRRGWIQ